MATFSHARWQQRIGDDDTTPTIPSNPDPDTWQETDIAVAEFYFSYHTGPEKTRCWTRSFEAISEIIFSADIQILIESLIDSAVTALQGGVPSQGDTLNKLYNLFSANAQAISDEASTRQLQITAVNVALLELSQNLGGQIEDLQEQINTLASGSGLKFQKVNFTGEINGSNNIFTLAARVTDIMVTLRGIELDSTNSEFTYDGDFEVTLAENPKDNDSLIIRGNYI